MSTLGAAAGVTCCEEAIETALQFAFASGMVVAAWLRRVTLRHREAIQ